MSLFSANTAAVSTKFNFNLLWESKLDPFKTLVQNWMFFAQQMFKFHIWKSQTWYKMNKNTKLKYILDCTEQEATVKLFCGCDYILFCSDVV